MGLGLKVNVGHVLGLERDLGLGVDPSYKPCWDHINNANLCPRSFVSGDLVWRMASSARKKDGKFSVN